MTATTRTRTRGDDWTISGVIEAAGVPVNLTGATITSQLRAKPDSSTVAATFTVAVVSAAAGTLTLSLSDTTTAALSPGTYTYDVQVVIGSTTTTYGVGSKLIVTADTTRAA